MQFASSSHSYDLQPGNFAARNNITFHLGGGIDYEFGRYYVLWRDGRMLVIQADPPQNPMPTIQDEDREYNSLLAIIQTMLDDIDFDRENWAYLIRDDDGAHLQYKSKPFSLSCTIFLPLIDENDIEITKWGGMNLREGRWNGKEVDLCTPYLEGSCWAALAEWQTEGHRLMQSLGLKDLTFPMLGHIVRDGAVVGVMTEASCGRLVEFTDRAAVYAAVVRMQQKGVIHRSLHAGNIFITDDGVRFIGISSVRFFEDVEELSKMAQKWHWDRLTEVFNDLKNKTVNDHPWLRKIPAPALLLPRLPSPSRSLPPIPAVADFSNLQYLFSLFLADPFKHEAWLQRAASSSDEHPVGRSNRRRAVLPGLRPIGRHGKHRIDLLLEEPHLGFAPYPSRMRIELAESRWPHYRGSSRRAIRDDVTVTSDSSDSTL